MNCFLMFCVQLSVKTDARTVGAALAPTAVLACMDSQGHSAREVRGGQDWGAYAFKVHSVMLLTMSECVFAVLRELFR